MIFADRKRCLLVLFLAMDWLDNGACVPLDYVLCESRALPPVRAQITRKSNK